MLQIENQFDEIFIENCLYKLFDNLAYIRDAFFRGICF